MRGPGKSVVIAQERLPVCMKVLDMLFKWMAERDRIRRKRLAGHPPPWSEDVVFREHKFCNVYRTFDRGTQYILREVINKGSQDHHEICFRIILFKLFNRISTWKFLEKNLGPLSWARFDIEAYKTALATARESSPIYTAAYQIPAPKLGDNEAFKNHLLLLKMMMENDLPGQLLLRKHMREAYEVIALYPGMGPFLSYQLLLDLNMSPHLDYSENEWATCGPGSTNCLHLIFGKGVVGLESDAIAYLHSTQHEHFARLGIVEPPRMVDGPSGVTFVDIEHSLCECWKYYRSRGIKGTWKASKPPITFDLPAKRKGTPIESTGVANQPTITRNDEIEDDGNTYEVSHIVRERFRSGDREYKVRWTGYGPDEDMWFSAEDLRNAPEVLKKWRTLRHIQDRINRCVEDLVRVNGRLRKHKEHSRTALKLGRVRKARA